MKINKLGFLSLLALLGVLGMIGHKNLYGFFGFAYYIKYFFVTPDELFRQNVKNAASIGFFSGIGASGIAVFIRYFFPELITSNLALASCYVASVFCFTIALVVLEAKEQWGN